MVHEWSRTAFGPEIGQRNLEVRDALQEEVYSTLEKIGDLKRDAGNFEAAFTVYEKRLDVARDLATSHPHSLEQRV